MLDIQTFSSDQPSHCVSPFTPLNVFIKLREPTPWFLTSLLFCTTLEPFTCKHRCPTVTDRNDDSISVKHRIIFIHLVLQFALIQIIIDDFCILSILTYSSYCGTCYNWTW